MQEIRGTGKEESRKGGIQEVRNAGGIQEVRKGFRRGGMQQFGSLTSVHGNGMN